MSGNTTVLDMSPEAPLGDLHEAALFALHHTGNFSLSLLFNERDLCTLDPSLSLRKAGLDHGSQLTVVKKGVDDSAGIAFMGQRALESQVLLAHRSSTRPSVYNAGSPSAKGLGAITVGLLDCCVETEVVSAAGKNLFVSQALSEEDKTRVNDECDALKAHIKETHYVDPKDSTFLESARTLAKAASTKRFQRELRGTGGMYKRSLRKIMRARVRSRIAREVAEAKARQNSLLKEGTDPAQHWKAGLDTRLKKDAELYERFAEPKPLLERCQRQRHYSAKRKAIRRCKRTAKKREGTQFKRSRRRPQRPEGCTSKAAPKEPSLQPSSSLSFPPLLQAKPKVLPNKRAPEQATVGNQVFLPIGRAPSAAIPIGASRASKRAPVQATSSNLLQAKPKVLPNKRAPVQATVGNQVFLPIGRAPRCNRPISSAN